MSPSKYFLGVSLIAAWMLGAIAAASCQERSEVLYDFRRDVDSKPQLFPGEERELLHRLFPKYLRQMGDCDSEHFDSKDNGPKEDLKTGQFVPSVSSLARGAFTAPGREETAYLVFMGECHAGPNFWTKRLVVVAGSRIVMQQEVPEHSIIKTFDLNGDGVQELLLEGGFTNMGSTESYARLVSLSGNHLKVIKDFKQVGLDSCDSGMPNRAVRATVITYLPKAPGFMPEFQSKIYEKECKPLYPR